MPNFILIPGVLLCYWWKNQQQVVEALVSLTACIPVVQCLLLLLLPKTKDEKIVRKAISLSSAVFTCARHFSTLLGEQLFQVIARTTFFNLGAGYLSVYALAIRIYSALRFILIDSYIAAKLATWKKELQANELYLLRIMNSFAFSFLMVVLALLIGTYTTTGFKYNVAQLGIILVLGFYFSTLVRIIYFKMNHHESQTTVVWRFTFSELVFAFLAFILAMKLDHPSLALVWLGYVAKPFSQLLLLRKRFLAQTLT